MLLLNSKLEVTVKDEIKKLSLPDDVNHILENCKSLIIPKTKEELYDLSLGGAGNDVLSLATKLKTWVKFAKRL